MDMSGQLTTNDQSVYTQLSRVCDADVRQTMLERTLAHPFAKRSTNLVPIGVLALNADKLAQPQIAYFLIALQLFVIIGAAAAVAFLLKAFESGKDSRFKHGVWLTSEGISGAIWGLMLFTIVNPATDGHSSSIVSVLVFVVITAGCLISTSAYGLSQAQIIGFASSSIPIALIYQDAFGMAVVIALIIWPFILWKVIHQMYYQVHNGVRTEMENTLLAGHLSEALEVADFVSRHDSLTSLLNRRELAKSAHRLRADRPQRKAMVLLIDLDNFKSINDRFGHATGDLGIRITANILRSQVNSDGAAAGEGYALSRWGGEEFVVVVADHTVDEARQLVEAMRHELANHHHPDWPKHVSLTASFGIATWSPDERLDRAIARADRAMYLAKDSGRDQFVFASA